MESTMDNEQNSADCNCQSSTACGCGESAIKKPACEDAPWVTGRINTPIGQVRQVSTRLSFQDLLGSWKARWNINRMNYTLTPGLYCVGVPDENSTVLVTANYKMSFDRLRKELSGLNAWIVVLDTKGINVWCAAGKGTFGTTELVYRLGKVKLAKLVAHRSIIVPQLGAPGISAHEVQKQSGFKVVYGPVRASDIKAFLSAGMKASPEMRTVKFTAWDRLVLTPVEIASAMKTTFIIFGVLFILNALGFGQYAWTELYAFLGALFVGCVAAPVLLPWIPGRAFAWKGWLLGVLWAVGVNLLNGFPHTLSYGWLEAIALFLILPAISAYCTMNFTGASTYTSLSGVKKEMRIAIPAMIGTLGVGILLLLTDGVLRILN